MRADMLLKYSMHNMEIWCHIPPTETRYSKLKTICEEISEQLDAPGLFGVVTCYDVLGSPDVVFKNAELAPGLHTTHSLCSISMSLPVLQQRTKDSELMKYVTALIEGMESVYGSVWVLEICSRSDTIYVKIEYKDKGLTDRRVLDPNKTLPGNDVKFMCDCGQFKSKRSFVSNCNFVINSSDAVGHGFYYNDSKRGCRDYISLGNGRFFQNMGYVDCGYVSNMHSGYSYYARARNIDERKVKIIPRGICAEEEKFSSTHAFGSIEEFTLFREASDGLKVGDACYMYCVVMDPEGNRRSASDIICWDGSKWVDFYKETEVKDWPILEPGWKLL